MASPVDRLGLVTPHPRFAHLTAWIATPPSPLAVGRRHRPVVGHQNTGGVAVDPARNLAYVANGLDDTLSVIDGATCNSTNTTGCAQAPPTVPGGPQPAAIVVNPLDGTVYAADNGGDVVSFFRFIASNHPTGLTGTRAGSDVTSAGTGPTPAACRSSTTWSRCPLARAAPASPPRRQAASRPRRSPASPLARRTRSRLRAVDAVGAGPTSAPSNPVRP
jgi:hypothetical protein